MLPVLIFDADPSVRMQILEHLAQYTSASQTRFSILTNTGSLREASRCLETEGGIMLLILGVDSPESEECEALALESRANEANRDSYSLFWLHRSQDLSELASRCLRPAGFIIPPPDKARFDQLLDRICQDYKRLASSSDEELMILQSGGSMYRLPIGEIDYIEAFDKKLNIWTRRQCLSVYESIAQAEKDLGTRFFRCHRSYLVNYSRIESVDFASMEITLTGGAAVPLSRSSKDKLKTRMMNERPNHGN